MPPSRKSCEGCHSQEPHQNDTIRRRAHFAPDKENTKTEVAVVLRTAERRNEAHEGIHWHLRTPVRYIATDPQKQHIPWLQVLRPGASKITYTDPEHPLSDEEVASSRVHEMDCIDCHNRSGHPFRNPEEAVDLALAKGKLDPRLPDVKARVVELLGQDFETQEEAMRLVTEAWRKYQKDFPNVSREYPEAWEEARQFAAERLIFAAGLMVRSKFLDPNVSWRSFPDHSGHRYAPGCFRCHSGRHRDADGNPLSVGCTLCHTVPAIIRQGQIPKTFLKTLYFASPPSHRQPFFMANHRTMVDDTCQACHGEIRYGVDDKTFCANSGCHGQRWPGLTLTSR